MMEQSRGGDDAWPSLVRGATIGRYVILAPVGRGAMGEVYAAYDPELDRKVAVKLLRTQGGSDNPTTGGAKARLLREAQAMAKLNHPNVITVHDVGSFGDRVFIAMEFVEGYTVGYWLLAERRSWREVRRVFMQAGRGLAAAHASQLIHRDFKLENVMVARDGHVRVMDFGLARRVNGPTITGLGRETSASSRTPRDPSGPQSAHAEGGVSGTRVTATPEAVEAEARHAPILDTRVFDLDATKDVHGPLGSGATASPTERAYASLPANLTQTGIIVGTPAYMAPEQFKGHPADERSDQFSFCVALYEGLYGKRPFAGKTVIELSENVCNGRVLPAVESAGVPSWLRRVVLRGMRVDPAERWPSMEALLDALQKDPALFWRRWSMVAVALAASVAIGVGALRQGAHDTRPTCKVSPDRFARVWEPSAEPDGRRGKIAAAFRASGQPYSNEAFAGTARVLDAYVSAWSTIYTDACQATTVRGEQSAEVLDLRMSCLRDRWSELRALSDVLVDPDAQVVANAVKAAGALTPLDRCSDIRTLRTVVAPPQDPAVRDQVQTLRNRLATVKATEDAGRFGKALDMAVKVVADARTVKYQPLLAEAMGRLGATQAHLNLGSEAEATLDEAIWTAEATRDDEIVAASSVEQIFVAGSLERDLPKARRWLRTAEAFLSRLEGHELMRAWMLNNLGAALDANGAVEEAVPRYREALRIKERVLGVRHPDLGASLTNLAIALMALGRLEEALQQSNRGVEILGHALGWEHPDTAQQLTNRADILNHLGRYADARADASRALGIWEREMGRDSPELVFFLGPLGEALLGLQDPGAAVAPLERALKIAQAQSIPSELRSLRFALAKALWDSGENRGRALQLGRLAASGAPGGEAALKGPQSANDRELQERAAAWLAAREGNGGRRSNSAFGTRFSDRSM